MFYHLFNLFESLGGDFAVDSAPGRGCNATVSLKTPGDGVPGPPHFP